MFELSEKIQFQCKNHIKHSGVNCWCYNLFAGLCFHRKKNNEVNNTWDFTWLNASTRWTICLMHTHTHKLKK